MKTSHAAFAIAVIFSFALCFSARAQETGHGAIGIPPLNDSSRLIQFDSGKLRTVHTPDNELGGFMQPLTSGLIPSSVKLPKSLTYSPGAIPTMKKLKIDISGYGHDDFINPERTVVFSKNATDRLSLFSANTIGVYKTLLFGNINYYNLNIGANYQFHSSLQGQSGIFYNSTLRDPLPIAGAYANFNYRAADNLWFDGGASYRKTLGNTYGFDQQSLMMELHSRYQIAENWFLNGYGGTPIYQLNKKPGMPTLPAMPQTYYGGTAEYWFKENMGVEGGLIWIRDIFTGKMRPSPKIELKFGPKK